MKSIHRPLRAAGLAAVLGLASPGAMALDLGAMTDAERSAFGAAVRSYLLENPEVLMEVIAALEARQMQDQAEADLAMLREYRDVLENDPDSWTGGNPEGDITVVEFVDYRCGYCRRAHSEVEALVAGDGNIRLVMKEFPILGEDSVRSARFAVATLQAHGADAYKAVHDALITLRGPADEAALDRIAAEAGLDGPALRAAMDGPEVTRVLRANQELAQRLQINGTPTFVIHETMVRGYVPLDGMQSIVAQQRERLD
ncbi:MAG: DsbA family protein [Gemmobacter sp.]